MHCVPVPLHLIPDSRHREESHPDLQEDVYHELAKNQPALPPFPEGDGNCPHKRNKRLHPLPLRYAASVADNIHMSCLSVSEIPALAAPLHFGQVQGSCQSPVCLPIFRQASANVPSDQKSPQEAQDPDDGSRSHSPPPLAHIQEPPPLAVLPPASSFWDKAWGTSG